MAKLTIEEIGQAKSDVALEGIPDSVKNPKTFEEIEKKLEEVMHSDHKHKKVVKFVQCKRCQKKLEKRRQVLKDYGFKGYEQYIKYRRIMDIITNEKDIAL